MIPDIDENYLPKQNMFDYIDSDQLSINDNIESIFLDFNNSLNFDSIKLSNIGTQPTSSLFQNINLYNPLPNNKNKGNNQKEKREEKKEKEEKEKKQKQKKMLGRKKKDSKEKGKHDKYSQDNIIRRIKTLLIKIVLHKINIYINEVYNMKIYKGIYKKQLLKINQKDILKTGNKQFLQQTLEDIFSNDISTKYKNSLEQASYNQKIIFKLKNEKDEEKRKKFNNLFKLTFLDCLKHFTESVKHKELEGLTTLKNLMNEKEFKEDSEYSKLFEYYAINFEEVIKNRKVRNQK